MLYPSAQMNPLNIFTGKQFLSVSIWCGFHGSGYLFKMGAFMVNFISSLLIFKIRMQEDTNTNFCYKQVKINFSVKAENYLKKKMVAPKVQVEFFDNPPTIGDIHHNQIFKFVENFAKFSKATNKVNIHIQQLRFTQI